MLATKKLLDTILWAGIPNIIVLYVEPVYISTVWWVEQEHIYNKLHFITKAIFYTLTIYCSKKKTNPFLKHDCRYYLLAHSKGTVWVIFNSNT